MAPQAAEKVKAVLESGFIGQGPRVEEFEQAFSRWHGHPRALTLNSGTAGLTLALRLVTDEARNYGEVLTQPITCTATNWPILATGHKIRWVDTNPADGNMDIEDLRKKISPKTMAIMVVHWGGYPNDLASIGKVQEECEQKFGYRPPIVEDAAHALGSEYEGKKIGNHGNLCAFSFQAIKSLTTGDGGALLCPNEASYRKARLLRWYGIDRTKSDNFRCGQDIGDWGYKYHMNDINAAIGLANLSLLQDTLRRHRENAAFYRQALSDVPGITLIQNDPARVSSYWLFTVRAQRRDDLQRKLQQRGIAAGRVHERNDKYTCTRPFRDPHLPGTDIVHREMLCIPVGWWVTEEGRESIVAAIREGW